MKINNLLLVAITLSIILVGCNKSQHTLPTSDEYPVITIGASNAQSKTTYPATIKGIQDVEIRPKVSGFITQLNVHEGQYVKTGQVLFVIDNSTYQEAVRQAQAQVAAAQSAVMQAQAGVVTAKANLNSATAQKATAYLTYSNSKNLYANKVIGEYELQSSKNSYTTAEASVRQAQSGISQAEAAVRQAQAQVKQAQAGLSTAKNNLSFCYVKSPTSGYIGSLPYKEGALVSPSSIQAVTTVSNVSTMEVYFSLTESDMLKLSRTEKGLTKAIRTFPAVSLQLIDGSIYNHEGTIVKTSGIVEAATGTISVIARFPNPERLLKSGGSGQIIIAKTDNHAIVIPQEAVVQVQDKMFVYKVDKYNKVHYTEIIVATENDGKNYIVTHGLKMGERIVVKGVSALTNGEKIKALTEAEYAKAIKKAQELSKSQSSASAFVKAMQSNDNK